MKILYLSEDNSIFDDKSEKHLKLLKFSSFIDKFFVVVLIDRNKKILKSKQYASNLWIYKASTTFKLFRIFKAFKIVSFELKANSVFQADLIVCEDQFISTITGYLLSKKFKRPLYVYLKEENEKKLFYPISVMDIVKANILWFILNSADVIKVDNFMAKEKLLKNSPKLNVELIKPFIDYGSLLTTYKSKINDGDKKVNLIKTKFPQLRFTSLVYINDIKQLKTAFSILSGINQHFPPTSLIILVADNIKISKVNRLIKRSWKPFVYVDSVNDDLIGYLTESNVFFGIANGAKYEELLNKACAVGARIIALRSDRSVKLIEDKLTGFICPDTKDKEIIDCFITNTFILMKDPTIALNFKVNLPYAFKNQFNETEDLYNEKFITSLSNCLEKYKVEHKKYYLYKEEVL